MRKIYSLVLIAAGLLIGTNSWADQVTVTYYGPTKTAEPTEFTGDHALQNAIMDIPAGDSAMIVLNTNQNLKAVVSIPYFTGDTTNWDESIVGNPVGEKPLRVRPGQRINLNMNGKTIQDDASVTTAIGCFEILKGTLHISGNGMILNRKTGATDKNEPEGEGYADAANVNIRQSAIAIFGAPAPFKSQPWTTVIIDEGITIRSEAATNGSDKNYGITIDAMNPNMAQPRLYAAQKTGYPENSTIDPSVTKGSKTCAYGVRLELHGDVYGTRRGLSIAGNIYASPANAEGYTGTGRKYKTLSQEHPFYYDNWYPYIKIYETADVSCYPTNMELDGNGGIYGAGYGVYDIIGATIHGQTGIFVKSGDMILTDATVTSESENAENGANYKDNVSGTGIFITSDPMYAGDIKVTLKGETTVEGGGEAAIVDVAADKLPSGTTQVSHISIEGGTIIPGDNGAILLTNEAGTEKTVVTGGNITGDIKVGTTASSVTDLTPETGYHVTVIEDADGNKVYAVSEGAAPTTGNKVSNQPEGTSVKWEGATYVEDEIIANQHLKLTEMEINDTITAAEHEANNTLVTGAARVQTLYVRDGATLEVGRVVLGPKARVIVEAGGKFIVTGKDGIAAVADDNITLKTQEGKPSLFLLNPDVKTNRCPMAKVEFRSKAYYTSSVHVYQRFGLPTKKGGLQEVVGVGDPETRFYVYDYDLDKWAGIGYINPSPGYASDMLDISKLNDPFEYYQMMNFSATTPAGVVYTFKGNLLGNDEPTMKIRENSWVGFANSYMGVMTLSELLNIIPNTVDKVVYVYNVSLTNGSWNAVSNLNSANAKLDPMQPFVIRNRRAAADVKLDYAATVYNPTINSMSNAPRRVVSNNITMAQINIANANSADYVIVAEDSEFTPSFDNGYDASKFMNDDVNLYVEADEKMSIFATDNLENTTLGVSSVLGGTYTMTFSNVNGDDLVLVDNMTGAKVAMTEGNSYEFDMAGNTVNDHRFSIATIAKIATGIENAEAVKSTKGIYSVTGMYLGEDISILPAGVYVVNGVKVVK